MESSNQQPQVQEVHNQIPSSVNNSSGSKLIPIILGVAAVVVIAIGAFVLGTKQTQPVVQENVQTTPIPTPTPLPVETSVKYDEQIAPWIMFPNKTKGGITYASRNPRYTFNYPPDWIFQPMSEGCGPVFKPFDGKYWLTICGPYLNSETPEALAKGARGKNSPIDLSNVTIDNHKGVKQELEYTENEGNGNYRNSISVYISDVQITTTDARSGEQKQTTGTIDVKFEGNGKKLTEEEKKKFDQILSTFQFSN